MKKISPKLRDELANDWWYKKCAVTGSRVGKIEWHHNLIYAGSQVNERFCIIPLSKSIHDRIHEYKELVDWIMVNRATRDELLRYSKVVDYLRMKERLNVKYGVWTSRTNVLALTNELAIMKTI